MADIESTLPSGSVSEQSYTVGVEEEYQLVDRETGELRSRARAVLSDDWSGEIKPELQQNTVEIGTRVCPDSVCLREELRRLRFGTAVAAEAQGSLIVAAGTHPFSHWQGQEFSEGAVYQRLLREYGRLAESQVIFGMHVHVSVPEGVDRIRVINIARSYLPHLLALSASSPFFLGDDTGYQSYRAILWRRWPRSGAPPRFRDQEEFDQAVRLLVDTGRIDAAGRLYWDIRPHHEYATVEFRVADVTPRLDDAVAIAALARALVAGIVEGEIADSDLPEPIVQTLLSDNAWRAARWGLDAEIVDIARDARRLRIRDAVLEIAERLEGVAIHLGDADAFRLIPELLQRGGAARRMREAYENGGEDWSELVRWIAAETVLGTGLDRRGEQRADG